MEKYLIDLVVIVLGAGVIWVVKSTLNGFKLELQEMFVLRRECDKQTKSDAEERERIRKDIEHQQERLNAIGAL